MTGERNMYGCLPCPQCGSVYRAAYRKAVRPSEITVIACDDCGRESLASLSKENENHWDEAAT